MISEGAVPPSEIVHEMFHISEIKTAHQTCDSLLVMHYIKLYAIGYLDIDKHLPQVPGRHDDCRVEFNNIALIQRNVVVSCEALC